MKAYGKKGAHKELAEISADMTLDEIIDMAEFFEDIRCQEERLRMEGRTGGHYHYRDYLLYQHLNLVLLFFLNVLGLNLIHILVLK